MFEQMLVALKPGGVAVFTATFSYIGEYWWAAKLAELEKLGRIRFISSENFFKYDCL